MELAFEKHFLRGRKMEWRERKCEEERGVREGRVEGSNGRKEDGPPAT